MTTPRVSVGSPGELVALVPYQLGFHPSDSLVIIGLDADGRRVVGVCRFDHVIVPSGPTTAETRPSGDRGTDSVQRTDSVQGADPVPGVEPPEIDEPADVVLEREVARVAAALIRGGVGAAVVLSYEECTTTDDAVFRALADALQAGGIRILFEATVSGGYGWMRPKPGERGHGFVIPHPSNVKAVASYVGQGVAPLAHRRDVTRLVEEDPVLAVGVAKVLAGSVAGQAFGDGSGPPRRTATWCRLLEGGSMWAPAATDVADLARSLTDHDWRDGLIGRLCPGVFPDEALRPDTRRALARVVVDPRGAAHEIVDRLARLCRAMPDSAGELTAEVLALTSAVAWQHGEGALAGDACLRARRVCPDHKLAGLLDQLLVAGVRPPRQEAPPHRLPRGGTGAGGRRASA